MADTWRSKCGNKYAKKDIEKWDSALKKELAALRQLPHNKKCFDCDADDCTWASPKLGIFICVACSDVHRAAGAHITCVKNFNTLASQKAATIIEGGAQFNARPVVATEKDSKSLAASIPPQDAILTAEMPPQIQEVIHRQVTLASQKAATIIEGGAQFNPRPVVATEKNSKSLATSIPPQDVILTAEMPVTIHGSSNQTVKPNVEEPFVGGDFWDSLSVAPTATSKLAGCNMSTKADTTQVLLDEFDCFASSATHKAFVAANRTSQCQAKELFDELDDFWASV
eukprot:CAMPEP_0169093204 /NCGR_PEP_ID=MMETSP1015-20121227/17312_1 /TAXON_ID=342587 /ORGANISM="Karlodinium micrum, Strain CCMP2283" /LENGTH=283 /DNA_ID=CAMNT_0009153829 /DNA_START=68 /DNA_END=919 /DNA_ORIENTATION=-